jgi:hypothetical protein
MDLIAHNEKIARISRMSFLSLACDWRKTLEKREISLTAVQSGGAGGVSRGSCRWCGARECADLRVGPKVSRQRAVAFSKPSLTTSRSITSSSRFKASAIWLVLARIALAFGVAWWAGCWKKVASGPWFKTRSVSRFMIQGGKGRSRRILARSYQGRSHCNATDGCRTLAEVPVVPGHAT